MTSTFQSYVSDLIHFSIFQTLLEREKSRESDSTSGCETGQSSEHANSVDVDSFTRGSINSNDSQADTDSDRADTSPDFLHRNTLSADTLLKDSLSADTLLKDSLSPLNCQENSFNKDQSDFTLTPSSLGSFVMNTIEVVLMYVTKPIL